MTSEFFIIIQLVEVAVLFEPVDLIWLVFEDDVAFVVAAKFPWFDKDDVVFAYPESSFESSWDSTVSRVTVETSYFAAAATETHFEYAQCLIVAWKLDSCQFFSVHFFKC